MEAQELVDSDVAKIEELILPYLEFAITHVKLPSNPEYSLLALARQMVGEMSRDGVVGLYTEVLTNIPVLTRKGKGYKDLIVKRFVEQLKGGGPSSLYSLVLGFHKTEFKDIILIVRDYNDERRLAIVNQSVNTY